MHISSVIRLLYSSTLKTDCNSHSLVFLTFNRNWIQVNFIIPRGLNFVPGGSSVTWHESLPHCPQIRINLDKILQLNLVSVPSWFFLISWSSNILCTVDIFLGVFSFFLMVILQWNGLEVLHSYPVWNHVQTLSLLKLVGLFSLPGKDITFSHTSALALLDIASGCKNFNGMMFSCFYCQTFTNLISNVLERSTLILK